MLAHMADWRQIQARIRKAKASTDAPVQLADLYERTHDGMVAFELAHWYEKAGDNTQAIHWYSLAAGRFRRAQWRTKSEEALTRLGAPIPVYETELSPESKPSEASVRVKTKESSAAAEDGETPPAEPSKSKSSESKASKPKTEDDQQESLSPADTPSDSADAEDASSPPANASSAAPAAGELAAKKRRRRGRRGGRKRRATGAGTITHVEKTGERSSITTATQPLAAPSGSVVPAVGARSAPGRRPSPSSILSNSPTSSAAGLAAAASSAASSAPSGVEASNLEEPHARESVPAPSPSAAAQETPGRPILSAERESAQRESGRAADRVSESGPAAPPSRQARTRAGEPAIASRISQLESQLRRLLACPLASLDDADQAPAGPGVLLLSDSDQVTHYYIEACQTLRIGIANLLRSGRGTKDAGLLKERLAENLGIAEARVSRYLKDHCAVRWLQLDEGAGDLAHFAIAVLRPVANE
jgi:hypothetical protein